MKMQARLCRALNTLFPLPVHPFNLHSTGISYGEWQYKKGLDTVKYYLPYTNLHEMFCDKSVLDIGCGAAGKTLFYADQGVKKIFGLDVLEKYRKDAENLALELGFMGVFEFVHADAAALPFAENSLDTIIMNDAFEHVAQPQKVLSESMRVLKPGGRLYINFPPYYHPFGAHLSDAIGIPWVHLFFNDATLIEVYRHAVAGLSDGKERWEFRIAKDEKGKEYFSYINKMTIARAKKIVKNLDLKPIYYHETPLRSFFTPLAKLPYIKELFIKMAVYIFEKN
ncbi:MAG: class I SAM-dependent methyltransferase [Firmicutes bacterium]|nr:class I SAM-dependent methyltransferase [Bacillota bacterium]